MATLIVNTGDGEKEVEAYKQGNNWYNSETNELILNIHIFWRN